jgi:hypothetical protein
VEINEFYAPSSRRGATLDFLRGSSMEKGKTRFIAVALTEAEWKALRVLKSDPSAWLKQQIDRVLEDAGVRPAAAEEDTGAKSASGEVHAYA